MVSPPSRVAASVARLMYTNAVYFPSSRVYRGDSPGLLDYSCINRVYYAHARVAPDGGVLLGDEWADARAPVDGVRGALGSLMHLKEKHPYLQVLLSVGGAASSHVFPAVAASALFRDNFAHSALGLVEASGLDGIDIAWEGGPSDAQQGSHFLALLAAVRMSLTPDRFVLTAALSPAKAVLQHVDLGLAADYLDSLNLTTYDYFGAPPSHTNHHAQLYATRSHDASAATAVADVLSQGFPPQRILLGIPAHARPLLHGAGAVDYAQLPRLGCEETVDRRHVAAMCVGPDGGLVSYDNPETVRAKAGFCKQQGLGGLFYSCGPADSRDGTRSLVAAGFRALHTL